MFLNKKFSLLKHLALIMLHDYLHCLVFKEQSVLSLSALASSDSFILSHSAQLVKNFFEVFFEAFRNSSVPRQSRLRYTVLCPCLSATCIILHETKGYVNTFFEKIKKAAKTLVTPLPCFIHTYKLQFVGVFVLKVSRSYAVRGSRGVLFLFPLKRPSRQF